MLTAFGLKLWEKRPVHDRAGQLCQKTRHSTVAQTIPDHL